MFATGYALSTGGIILIVVGFLFYFIPTIIALLRNHPNGVSILIVNFFLGWMLIGWVIALAWSCSAKAQSVIIKNRRSRRRYEDEDYD